jgi:hypothetical protein
MIKKNIEKKILMMIATIMVNVIEIYGFLEIN